MRSVKKFELFSTFLSHAVFKMSALTPFYPFSNTSEHSHEPLEFDTSNNENEEVQHSHNTRSRSKRRARYFQNNLQLSDDVSSAFDNENEERRVPSPKKKRRRRKRQRKPPVPATQPSTTTTTLKSFANLRTVPYVPRALLGRVYGGEHVQCTTSSEIRI